MSEQQDDPMTKSAELRHAGSQIHYWVTGPDDGPLVAFTHGASMDHRMFDSQVSSVGAEGYRVLTWDVRGHGLSKPLGEAFTVSAVAEDLLALLDQLGHETAVLVGHSFGGSVSQELAFRYPERVEALVVFGTTDITAPPSRRELLVRKLLPYIFKLWPESHLRQVIAKNTAVKSEVQRYAYEATGQLSKNESVTVWKAVANCLHEELGYQVQHPFLLTHGEYDNVGSTAKAAPTWAEREPNSRYEVIPDAGHNANQDNPAAFNRLLLAFLKEHAPA